MAIWRGAPTQDLILDTQQPAGVTTPSQLGFEEVRPPGPQPRPFHRLEQHDEQWPFPVIVATPTQFGFEEDRPPPHRSLPHQPPQEHAPLTVVAVVPTPTQLGFEDQAPPRPQRVPFHRLEQHDERYPLPSALTPTQLGFESEQHGPQRPLFHRLEQHDDQWKSLPPPVSTPTQFGFEGQQPPRPFVFPFHRLDQHDEQWPFTAVPPPPILETVIRRYRADPAGHVLRRLLLSGVTLPPSLPFVNDEGRTPHASAIPSCRPARRAVALHYPATGTVWDRLAGGQRPADPASLPSGAGGLPADRPGVEQFVPCLRPDGRTLTIRKGRPKPPLVT